MTFYVSAVLRREFRDYRMTSPFLWYRKYVKPLKPLFHLYRPNICDTSINTKLCNMNIIDTIFIYTECLSYICFSTYYIPSDNDKILLSSVTVVFRIGSLSI